MNNCVILGRLVRDPEVRYTQKEHQGESLCIARFTLAVDRRIKKDGEASADFINCVAFGKTAEVIEKHVYNGNKIAVAGHIQTGSYTNKEGQKVYTTDVIVDAMDFCESKNSSGNNSADRPTSGGNDFMNIPEGLEEDLPFNKPGAKYNDDAPKQTQMDDLPFSRT